MTLNPRTPLLLAALLLGVQTAIAYAQDTGAAPGVAAPESPAAQPGADAGTPSIQSSLGKYGDPGGIRAYLQTKGITYSISYIGEVLGNTSGGVKQGATYEDVIFGKTDVDLEKLAGLTGLTAHASGYSIQGRGLTGNNLMNYFTVSSIEAYPSTVLYEAWLQKTFANDKIAIRVGNLAADSDSQFFISDTAQNFVNSDFGWPTILATNLPTGGNAFPIGTPGISTKIMPTDKIALLAAVYDGDPYGPYVPGVNSSIPLQRNPGGLNFRLQDPPFFITEGDYAYNQDKDSPGLPGKVRLGYLHHFGSFQSNTFPNVNLRGDDGVYGIIDQMIYRKKGTDDQGMTGFARVATMPGDRNFFDIYFDAGVIYKGLIPGRDNDVVGISGGYGRVSPAISQSDIANGNAPLIEDYEGLLEATYSISVVPGFTLQPDFQYIFHPGAHGVANPQTGLPIHNASVFGLRTNITY